MISNWARKISVLMAMAGAMVMPGTQAQETVAPPAAPVSDDGPSLADTMQFIEGKMNHLGASQTGGGQEDVGAVRQIHNSTYEIHDVVADPTSCKFRARTTRLTVTTFAQITSTGLRPSLVAPQTDFRNDDEYSGSFKDVQQVKVHPEQGRVRFMVISDTNVFQYHSTIWRRGKETDTVVKKKTVKTMEPDSTSERNDAVSGMVFYLHDEDMANRLAKAMTHAVELCQAGQKPEPF